MKDVKLVVPEARRPAYELFREGEPCYQRYAQVKKNVARLVKLPAAQRPPATDFLDAAKPRALLRNWGVPVRGGYHHPLDFVDACLRKELAEARLAKRCAKASFWPALGCVATLTITAAKVLLGMSLMPTVGLAVGGVLLAVALGCTAVGWLANARAERWFEVGYETQQATHSLIHHKEAWLRRKQQWLDAPGPS